MTETTSTSETRRFLASGFFVLILVALLAYLTFIPVPDSNKDLIVTILGVLMGGAAAAMPNLFGSSDAEKDKLTSRVRSLEQHVAVMEERYSTLKTEYDRLTAMLVDRHLVPNTEASPASPQKSWRKGATQTAHITYDDTNEVDE